jgi:hypothetical protein
MSTCRDLEPLLSQFVDGDLTGDERATVVAHLDVCAACRGVMSDLERVRGTARFLGPVAPPDHLWLEVAGQIHMGGPQAVEPAAVERRRGRVTQWLGLAAALVVATLAVYFVDVARKARPADTPPSVDSVAQELTLALEHYDNAIADLQAIAQKNEGTLDPTIALTLQRNLAVIDSAFVDSRAALKTNPTSEPARETLLDALQRKIGVLQTTVALMNEMRKGDARGTARIIGGKS